jgi:hypothetical protein
MKTHFLIISICILTLAACTPSGTSTPVPELATVLPTDVPTLPPTSELPDIDASTPLPEGKTITVTSNSNGGPGSLRRALRDAEPYDTIIFDPAVFPPDAPETIMVSGESLGIYQGHVTVDASNAGVILDGSNLPAESWQPGLDILSDWNTIQGLQVTNFTGVGIVVALHGKHNTIGGDRGIGAGPLGQGNLTSNNAHGIGLWDFASNNIVSGNLVGTDSSGALALGNRNSGVLITGGGMDNVIGADNVIAYNRRCGIEVDGAASIGNTLSQNSIYGNGENGICLVFGGNDERVAPLITGIDLAMGHIAGSTCANCMVEIFSDGSDEGEVYEGQVTADGQGLFTFTKGEGFTRPLLTTCATYSDGNTSEFSPLMPGAYGALSLQLGNDLPLARLSPRPSQDLLDNHTGAWFEDHDRYDDTAFVYRNGFKRIRIGALSGRDENGWLIFHQKSIPPEVDETISEYASNGVEIEITMGMGSGLLAYQTSFQGQADIDQYIDFVRMVVSQFKGRVPYYEIWNEPGNITINDYANLIRQVVPVIRELDPEARIIVGAYAGPWDYGYPGYGEYQRFSLNVDRLNNLIRSGVAPLVDGISWHPLYDNISNDPYYQNYPKMVEGIKELAASQGFSGEFFADEVLWTTGVVEEDSDGGPTVSTNIAAKMYTRAIAEHRGLDVNLTINTFFQEGGLAPIQNINHTLAGTEPIDMEFSIEGDTSDIRTYAFSLPDGDRLIALWNNGEVLENDPGIEVSLTIPGASGRETVGIDVFYGFEQELITEIGDDELIIRELLVRDYPIFIRFSAY